MHEYTLKMTTKWSESREFHLQKKISIMMLPWLLPTSRTRERSRQQTKSRCATSVATRRNLWRHTLNKMSWLKSSAVALLLGLLAASVIAQDSTDTALALTEGVPTRGHA